MKMKYFDYIIIVFALFVYPYLKLEVITPEHLRHDIIWNLIQLGVITIRAVCFLSFYFVARGLHLKYK